MKFCREIRYPLLATARRIWAMPRYVHINLCFRPSMTKNRRQEHRGRSLSYFPDLNNRVPPRLSPLRPSTRENKAKKFKFQRVCFHFGLLQREIATPCQLGRSRSCRHAQTSDRINPVAPFPRSGFVSGHGPCTTEIFWWFASSQQPSQSLPRVGTPDGRV